MAIPLRDNAPKGSDPVVVPLIIVICVVIYGLECLHPGGIEAASLLYGEIPARILSGEPIPGTQLSAWWTVLSSMFMHGGFMHILGNMWMLWLFGDNIEWLMGRARFAVFYLLCGIIASLLTLWLGSGSDLPGVGASGAIAGVMAAYLLCYPRARITSFVYIRPYSMGHAWTGDWGPQLRNISAIWFIGAWVVLQFIFSSLYIASGTWINLGVYAHLGGAFAGALLCHVFVIQSRRPAADHPVNSGDYSDMFYGDEGDAGTSSVPVQRLGALVQELRHEGPQPLPAGFHDTLALDLVEHGQLEEALRHCREMQQLSEQDDNHIRVLGYRRLIAELETTLELQRQKQLERNRQLLDSAAVQPATGRAAEPLARGLDGLDRRIAARRRELELRRSAADAGEAQSPD